MKHLFINIVILIIISTQYAFSQYTSVSFYIVAHQDDWQLFMGKDAYDDMVQNSNKVVFIYITSGDACNKTSDCAFKIPYFISRENGAKNSVYLVVDNSSSPPAGSYRPVNTTVSVNKHSVTKWQYKNVVKYFLRLPDGHIHLKDPPHFKCGFDPRDSTYINNFRRGILNQLSDITGLTIYYGWSDLVNTIRTILISERFGSIAWIHTHEFSPALNFATHPDHRETGLIVENIFDQTAGFNIAYHIDYQTYNMDVNLSHEDIIKETGMFAAYNGVKINDGCPTDWNENDLKFCMRNYISRYFYNTKPSNEQYGKNSYLVEISPNPAFQSTVISIIVPYDDTVSCSVYDIGGRLVKNLINRKLLISGKYTYSISQLPQGVYVLKLVTQSGFTHEMTLFFH